MGLRRLDKHKTKAQQVYEQLREEISTGRLPPGHALVIQHLAEQLNVSEIPVREALQQLKYEGLVKSVPYTGTVVAPLSLDRIRQTMEVRAVLEGFACRLAVPHLTSDDHEHLAGLIASMDTCIERRDMTEYSRVNRAFHEYIHRRCPNERARELLAGLLLETERARAVFVVRPDSAVTSNAEHKLLLNFIREGDADAADALMRAHQLRAGREFTDASGSGGDA